MRTAYHRDAGGLAFNVKRYGMADLRGTDDQRELAYTRAQEVWWSAADELAKAHGFDGIITVGRNGGWAAPFPGVDTLDAEPETMARFSALEDAMEAHLRDADSLFSSELDSVIEDDARTARADAIVKRQYAERAALPAPYNLSAVEWIERACATLEARITKDTELLGVFDDLQRALRQLRGPRA